jgi:hypothetical protein
MNCEPLASTGVPVEGLLGFGGMLLLAGVGLVMLARARRGRMITGLGVVLMMLMIGSMTNVAIGPRSANAATSACSSSPQVSNPTNTPSPGLTTDDGVTIVQTSTMTGLAPGVAPVAITGTITNRAATSTVVTAVTVDIAAVTKAVAATGGTCDASDYILLGATMPVGQTLAVGESANFAGAQIGFNDKTVNQDACRRAVVNLSYVSS